MVQIDGKYYYSPCEKCQEPGCFGCIVEKNRQDLKNEQSERVLAEQRIKRELIPRIEAEKLRYDSWVLTDTGEWQYKNFVYLVDDMISFVEKNEQYMDWDSSDGDLEEMILYLIRHRDEESKIYISQRQEGSSDEEKV